MHSPIFQPEPEESTASSPRGRVPTGPERELAPGNNMENLALAFATRAGGTLPPELSASLALDVVLNELVEQACLATTATGAAIVLDRQGEMVCRAAAGTTAPGLGARLDTESGLTGLCLKTQEVLRCNDAFVDPRADGEASRQLGVRSLLILPLMIRGNVVGVFELLSSRPNAFSERDEQTLAALSRRVMDSLNRAAAPSAPWPRLPQDAAVRPAAEPAAEPAASVPQMEAKAELDSNLPAATPPKDLLGIALGAAIMLCALSLVGVLGLHWAGGKLFSGGKPHTSAQASPRPRDLAPTAATKSFPSSSGSVAGSPAAVKGDHAKGDFPDGTSRSVVPVATGGSAVPAPSLPAGSLRVFAQGREVFRMLPDGTSSSGDAIQQSGLIHRAAIVELSPDAVESSLVYRVEPVYPSLALTQKVEGTVVLNVKITPIGLVQAVTVRSGSPLLAVAAEEAVKQWRFREHLVGGQRVAMQTQVRLNFRLPRE